MSELILKNLHKRYGTHMVLDGLDMSVPAASFTALLGNSGAGKTTLLRLLAGFEAPDLGTISVGGQVLSTPGTNVPPERRKIGFVPQEGSLFPHLSVAANIGFGLPRRERRGRRGRRVRELLELVGLSGLERRYPHELSGGQQQRVALARALAVKPEVVLLDEPFAALDEHLRDELRQEVKQILVGTGATTLLVTHNQNEALSIADFVAVLRDGKIVQQATPQQLYAAPVDHRLAGFIGAANLVDGVLADVTAAGTDMLYVNTRLGRLPARYDGPPPACPCRVTALLRPEQIQIVASGTGDGSPGRVVGIDFYGHATLLSIELSGCPGMPPLVVRVPGSPAFAVDDRCELAATGTVLIWHDGTRERLDPGAVSANSGEAQPVSARDKALTTNG